MSIDINVCEYGFYVHAGKVWVFGYENRFFRSWKSSYPYRYIGFSLLVKGFGLWVQLQGPMASREKTVAGMVGRGEI